MEPKVREQPEWRHHSDVAHSFSQFRDHQALYRSTGHLFRDGRWTGTEDSFHQFGEIDSPGFGSNRTFDGSTYWGDYVVPPYGSETHRNYNWRLCVGRTFTTRADTTYDVTGPRSVDPVWEDSVLDLVDQGTSFIRRYRPGSPLWNLGQFVIELRDLPRLPRLLQRRADEFRSLGSEYLNLEFGWSAFVKDCIGVYRLQRLIKDRYDRLIKDNGLSVRKRSKRVITNDSNVVAAGVLSVPFGHLGDTNIGGAAELDGVYVLGPNTFWDINSDFTGESSYFAEEKTRTEVWSQGTFRYYVPDIGSDRWTSRFIAVMFGAVPTPAQLYAVYPWTWLIDWFTNVGDIVSNLSANAVDNETLTNCYAMRNNIVTKVVNVRTRWDELNFAPFNPMIGVDIHMHVPAGEDQATYIVDRDEKLRLQASPYGFGVSSASFSARQWAILAALSVTRQGFFKP